jgi:hypothetical protein
MTAKPKSVSSYTVSVGQEKPNSAANLLRTIGTGKSSRASILRPDRLPYVISQPPNICDSSKFPEIASLLFNRLLTNISFWGIFYIDASSRQNAAHTFNRIAKIGIVEQNEWAAKNYLSTLDRPWMLIVDNADDPNVSLEEYFLPGERGFILVTTRVPSNKVHGTIGDKFYHFEKLEMKKPVIFY